MFYDGPPKAGGTPKVIFSKSSGGAGTVGAGTLGIAVSGDSVYVLRLESNADEMLLATPKAAHPRRFRSSGKPALRSTP